MQKKASNIIKKLLLSTSIPLAATTSFFAISCKKTFNKISNEALLSGKLQSKLSVLEVKWNSIEDRDFKSNHQTKYRSLMKIAKDAITSNKENEIEKATTLIDDFIRDLFFNTEEKVDIKDYLTDVDLYWQSYERFVNLMQNQYISDAYNKVKQKYERQSLRYKNKDYNIYLDGSKLINVLSKDDKKQVKVFAKELKNKVDAFEKELKDINDTSTYNNAPKLDERVPKEIHIDWNYDVIPKLKELVNKTWDTETADKIRTGQTYGEVIKMLGEDLSKHFNEIPKEYIDYWSSDILNPEFLKNEVLQLQDKKSTDRVEILKDHNFNVRAFNSDIISLSYPLAGFSAEEAIKYLFNNYVVPKLTPFHSKIVVNNELKKLIKKYENRFPNLKDKEYNFDDSDLTTPFGFSKNLDGTLKVKLKTFMRVSSKDYPSSSVALEGDINIKYPNKSEWDPETMASPTKYIGIDNIEYYIYDKSLWKRTDIKEITQIGYYVQKNSKYVQEDYKYVQRVYKYVKGVYMPQYINKVSQLPNVITNIESMFGSSSSHRIENLDKWDTSNITNMNSLFSYAHNFNQDLQNWNVSNVQNMKAMFYGAKSFNQPLDRWNPKSLKNMESMFYTAYSFNQNLSSWHLKKDVQRDYFNWYTNNWTKDKWPKFDA